MVQDVPTQLFNTVKQVGVIATVLITRGAVLLVQDVAAQLVNTVKQVGVIDSVPTTMGEVLVLLVQVITSGNNLSSNQSTWER